MWRDRTLRIFCPLDMIVSRRLAGPAVVLFAEFAGGGSGMGSRRRARAGDIADRVIVGLYPLFWCVGIFIPT